MEQKKILDTIKEKKWIFVGAAIVVLILILILLLNCCGSGDGSENPADNGGSTSTSTSTSTSSIDDGGDSGIVDVNPEDKTYDEDLISTWYKDDIAMVLNEEGVGSLYYGDEDGGEIQWYTVGNQLVLITEADFSAATYVINGDDLTLTFSDGQVENWFR